jgi:hypothetical protein
VRALLVARKLLLGKLCDVELSLRGVLRGFGLKMGHVTRKGFEARVRELCAGQAILEEIADAMLSARASLDLPLLSGEPLSLALLRVRTLWGFCSRGPNAGGRDYKSHRYIWRWHFRPGVVAGAPDQFGFDRLEHCFHHGIDAPISVKWFSGVKSTIVERRINSRRSCGRRSA